MNSKTIVSLVFLFSLLITSCKKELKPQDSADSSDTTAVIAPAVVPDNQMTQTQPAAVQPNPANQTVQAPAAKTAPGMNPPHGQPNHRCDIAVGAPLNSAPAKKPAAPQTVTPGKATVERVTPASAPSSVSPALPAETTATAPGMNPPHGQPNHRCDVAVGAPLPQ